MLLVVSVLFTESHLYEGHPQTLAKQHKTYEPGPLVSSPPHPTHMTWCNGAIYIGGGAY